MKMTHKNNLKSKTSWHCPFKQVMKKKHCSLINGQHSVRRTTQPITISYVRGEVDSIQTSWKLFFTGLQHLWNVVSAFQFRSLVFTAHFYSTLYAVFVSFFFSVCTSTELYNTPRYIIFRTDSDLEFDRVWRSWDWTWITPELLHHCLDSQPLWKALLT